MCRKDPMKKLHVLIKRRERRKNIDPDLRFVYENKVPLIIIFCMMSE